MNPQPIVPRMTTITGLDQLDGARGQGPRHQRAGTRSPRRTSTQFAEVTGDHQWIHVDPERAKETPFGGTIAHGYYTLSLAPRFSEQIFELEGFAFGVNYGLNKVRFPAPLPVGGKVRMQRQGRERRADPGRRAAHARADLRARGRREARLRRGDGRPRLRRLKQPRQLRHVGEDAGAVEARALASSRRSRTRSSRPRSAASTPAGESSTTAQSAGSQPIDAAACRNRSGAGLPCSTSVALKIRPSKRSHSPVCPSVKRIFSIEALDATQLGSVIASSAATIPGTGRSSCLEGGEHPVEVAAAEALGQPAALVRVGDDGLPRPPHELLDRLLGRHRHARSRSAGRRARGWRSPRSRPAPRRSRR